MRFALVALVVLILGTIQGCSDVALRGVAANASVVRFVPGAVVRAVDAQPPRALQTRIMRYVLGTYALDRRAPEVAAAFARSLPPGPDRDVLEAALAEARGDLRLAVAKMLDAGDRPRLQRRIDELVASGRLADALALERAVLARLVERRAQRDTIAEATYRLGLLDQATAYTYAPGDARHDAWQARSRDAYAEAFRLAPLEDRYGLALGNEALNVGDLAAARTAFGRVRELDPASTDPLTGLADAAIRAHDFATARGYLDAAERLAPGSPAVARMRARVPVS